MVETVRAAFQAANTGNAYTRAKRLAEKLTGAEQRAIVDEMIDASRRVGR